MRPEAEVDALRLVRWGVNDCEIARLTGIPRRTILDWRVNEGRPGTDGCGPSRKPRVPCPVCSGGELDPDGYAYLLGLYLGDGCLVEHARKVFRLRIVLDERYPGIISECIDAIARVVRGHTARWVRCTTLAATPSTATGSTGPVCSRSTGPDPSSKGESCLRRGSNR